jgi:hypothetical protein
VQAPRHPYGEDGDRERRQSERRAGTGWLRQLSLIYSGLIIGVYLVAPFLTAASLDLPAKVCVVAFSVAIPLLAAGDRQPAGGLPSACDHVRPCHHCVGGRANLAFVGVVAGFWHITWIAGVGMLAGGLVGVAVHSAGYTRLERDQAT